MNRQEAIDTAVRHVWDEGNFAGRIVMKTLAHNPGRFVHQAQLLQRCVSQEFEKIVAKC